MTAKIEWFDLPKRANWINYIGHKFGRLTVIEYAGIRRHKTIWGCQCECGNKLIVTLNCLKSGNTKSCGCYKKDKMILTHRKHGKTHTSEYQVWQNMKARCNKPSHRDYHRYGARGIKVCKRWQNSFSSFLSDMGHRPSKKHTIERIDNDKGYEPNNCEWATHITQARNRKTNTYLEFQGHRKIMIEWCEELGLSKEIVCTRLKRGWSVKKTLSTPPIDRSNMIEYNGKTQSITDWSRETGITVDSISDRLNRGWTIEKALTTTHDARRKKITFRGRTQSLKAWCQDMNLTEHALSWRLRNGWTVEKALMTPVKIRKS